MKKVVIMVIVVLSMASAQLFKNSPVYQMLSETKKQFAWVSASHVQIVTPYIPQLHELFDYNEDDDLSYRPAA